MELLLNLLWLMLALPAIWLWRREARCSRQSRPFKSWHCLLVLACLLTLLFPVISATDDLHPMRPEMEESSSSKRAFRLASAGSGPQHHFSAPPAQLTSIFPARPNDEILDAAAPPYESLPQSPRSSIRAGRAPPSFLLA